MEENPLLKAEDQPGWLDIARLCLVGQLVNAAAHDLKSPLGTILMGHEFISRSGRSTDEVFQSVLEETTGAVRRLQTFVAELVDLAAAEAPSPLPGAAELNGIVERSLVFARPQLLRHGVQVEKDLAPGLPPLACCPRLAQQALLGILIPASGALRRGEILHVATGWAEGTGFAATPPASSAAPAEASAPAENRRVAVVLESGGLGAVLEEARRFSSPPASTAKDGQDLLLRASHSILTGLGGVFEIRTSTDGWGRATLVFLARVDEWKDTRPRS